MNCNFYIIDDDKGIRKVLKNIIAQYDLGDVIGEAGDGVVGIEEIKELSPHIVLIDLLLPGIDGISIVSEIKKFDREAIFIMISQVTAKEMISKAYTSGIEFYIHKPLNVIEVIAVISKVKEKLKMQEVIQSFEKAIHSMNILREHTTVQREKAPSDNKDKIKKLLSQIGILGDSGSNDIVEIIHLLFEWDKSTREKLLNQRITDLLKLLQKRYQEEHDISISGAALEQRIRRAINKALANIANLGLEDYSNDVFVKFSNTLFDFQEVRKQMDYIRGKANYGGKINMKKFIEGIMVELNIQ